MSSAALSASACYGGPPSRHQNAGSPGGVSVGATSHCALPRPTCLSPSPCQAFPEAKRRPGSLWVVFPAPDHARSALPVCPGSSRNHAASLVCWPSCWGAAPLLARPPQAAFSSLRTSPPLGLHRPSWRPESWDSQVLLATGSVQDRKVGQSVHRLSFVEKNHGNLKIHAIRGQGRLLSIRLEVRCWPLYRPLQLLVLGNLQVCSWHFLRRLTTSV